MKRSRLGVGLGWCVTMGQFCSSEDDDQDAADRYAHLVSRFNNGGEGGEAAGSPAMRYGGRASSSWSFSSQTGEPAPLTAVGDAVDGRPGGGGADADWDMLAAGTNGGGGQGGAYSPPASPTVEDDSTTSVMLYDIQFRMTDSHVVYVLQLKFKGIPNPGWTITKRYRQFADLHAKLMRTYRGGNFRKLPKLPGKQLFSNQRLAQERQAKLGTYIRYLLAMDLRSNALAKFLGIP